MGRFLKGFLILFSKIRSLLTKYDFILVTASTVVCSAMSFIFNVYARSLVNPDNMGIYSTCLLLQTYLTYAQLGVLNSYNRDYPQALGRKDYEDADKMRNSVFSYLISMFLIVTLVVDVAVAIIYHGNMSDYYAFGYLVVPVILLVKCLDDCSVSTARIQGKYNYSAGAGFLRTCIAMALGVVAINLWGYYGLYVMPFASAVLGIIFFGKYAIRHVHFLLDFSYIKGMILGGLPLLFESLIWTLVSSVDKFVILIFMTRYDLGVYSVPIMGFTTMVLIPQTISGVFYNKISRLYGATGDEMQLLDEAAKYTGIVSTLTGGACVGVFYLLPLFVQIFMPKYTDGNAASQILIIGVAIYSTTMILGNIFSVLKLNISLIMNSIYLCIFNTVFSTGLVLLVDRTIEMVAVGTLISYALYSLLLIFKLNKRFGYSVVKLLKKSWMPLLMVVIPGILFYFIIPSFMVALILSVFTVLGSYAIIYVKWKNK